MILKNRLKTGLDQALKCWHRQDFDANISTPGDKTMVKKSKKQKRITVEPIVEQKNTDRDYQQNSVDELHGLVKKGFRRILMVSPTGSGKTHIASMIIKRALGKGNKVLFLAHRHSLLNGCYEKLISQGVPVGQICLLTGGRDHFDAPVCVASIKTLVRRKLFPDAQIVFIDEAHHVAAPTYIQTMNHYQGKLIIGLTATPVRLDGKQMSDFFEEMIEAATVPDLIGKGFLVNPTCYKGVMPDVSSLKKGKSGQFKEKDLEHVSDKPTLIGDIYRNWERICYGVKTAVFAVTVTHAEHIREVFVANGISAEVISYHTPAKIRDYLMNEWQFGDLCVVISVELFIEGVDFPKLQCVIMARHTESLVIWLQAAGRIMRIADGKDRAYLLDHVGCIDKFGLPSIKREWSLTSIPNLQDQKAKKTITCPHCHLVYIPTKYYVKLTNPTDLEVDKTKIVTICPSCKQALCPDCGDVFTAVNETESFDDIATINQVQCAHCDSVFIENTISLNSNAREAIPDSVDADLEVVTENDEIPEHIQVANTFHKLMNVAKKKGLKRGWVYHSMLTDYGYSQNTLLRYLPRHTSEWWRSVA
jgi:superfamily II DNA or RNA helicase